MDEDNGMNFAEFVALLSGNTDLLEKTKLDNKIMQLEKEQAIFKKDRIRAERKIAANREDMTKAESAAARMTQDWEYITSYTGDRTGAAPHFQDLPQRGNRYDRHVCRIEPVGVQRV